MGALLNKRINAVKGRHQTNEQSLETRVFWWV